MADPVKNTQWDEFDAPVGRPKTESVLTPSDAPQKEGKKTQWDEYAPVDDAMLEANSGFLGALHNFFKFGGHGSVRGFANTLGFPVDSFNMAGEFLANHPEFLAVSRVAGPLGGLLGDAAKTVNEARGGKAIYAGSGQNARDVANKIGLPTSTPKEEGNTSTAAYWGDVLGEFGAANLPFVANAPVRVGGQMMTNAQRILQSKRPLSQALHDLVAPVAGPGIGAGVGGELVDPQNEDLGKMAGGIIGSARPLIFDKAVNLGGSVQSWLHGWLGMGTGATAKVGEALAKSAHDLPAAAKEVANLPTLSSGAKIPADIASQDAGLFALRRTVMAKDAEMAGDYRAMQNATERAIEADMELSPANFNDPFVWLGAKQKVLETTVNHRLMQAVNQAEHDTEIAFRGVTPNQTDANNTKNAYATNLRRQILAARDDMDAVVREKWANVDKEIPVDMSPVYDEINTMKAEHKGRPGQSQERFPSKFIDRFFEDDAPKFGVNAKLQDVIDLDSEVRQAIRELSAADAPDRVKMSYLERLSKSLYKAKERLPDASTNVPLKDALNTTKTFHDTFSRGPVGQVLGHDVPGAPDVSPGETIKFFLSQGPGGVDSFDALMKAVKARTGKMDANAVNKGWKPPSDQMEKMLDNYIRQDFFDVAAPNGQFSEKNAQRWMKNNAGALNHFPELRKEFENALKSAGTASEAREFAKQELQDIQRNRAALFLDGDPGRLFNGALKGPDKYGATKELVNMTKDDPTGRATEGLVQMAFDHLLASSKIADPSLPALERLSGRHILDWMKENAGVVKALDEALPKATTQRLSANAQRRLPADLKDGKRRTSGVADRFERIAKTAHYLEGFRINPEIAKDQVQEITPLTELLSRYMGAGIGSSVASHGSGHSLQMAAVGSKMFRQLAAALTPEQTAKVMRAAMTDPGFFELLTKKAATSKEAQESIQLLQPYFYSMGIPLVQPAIPQPHRNSAKDEGGGADIEAKDGSGPTRGRTDASLGLSSFGQIGSLEQLATESASE